MISLNDFENFIHSDLVYEQKIISVIDEQGRQIFLDSVGDLYKYNSCTIKLEQMEKYSEDLYNHCAELAIKFNHLGPVTCHIFRAFKNSKSFGLHTDPDSVVLHCVYGQKNMFVNDIEHVLMPGDVLSIKANTPHEAINKEESLMLSFGLEDFYVNKVKLYELDVLSKNN